MKSKVILINDPPIDQIIIDSILARFDVLVVSDASEAISQMQTLPDISLVIFDVDMEHMDVFKFLKKLNSGRRTKNIHKIIFATDCELDKEIEESKSVTIDCMKKPIRVALLKARILLHVDMVRFQYLLDEKADENSLTLNTLLDQAPMGIVIAYGDEPSDDVENDPAIINPMFEKMTGRTRKELIELGWAKITHPDDRKKDIDNFNDLLCFCYKCVAFFNSRFLFNCFFIT